MDAAAAAGTAGDAASETAQERPQDLFFHHRDILDTPQHVESGQRVYYRFQMGTEGAREGKPQAKLVRAVTEVTALKPEDEVAPPVAPEAHALAMLGFAKSHRAEWQSWLESKDNEALQVLSHELKKSFEACAAERNNDGRSSRRHGAHCAALDTRRGRRRHPRLTLAAHHQV